MKIPRNPMEIHGSPVVLGRATEARPEVKILNGLSLTLQRGQKAAVVGESGSGKSTAPRMGRKIEQLVIQSYHLNKGLYIMGKVLV